MALALHDRASAAESFTDAARLVRVKTWGSTKCTALRWEELRLKTPVFRRFRRPGMLSESEGMLYAELRDKMGWQSLDAVFEKRWTPRFPQRDAGGAANGM